MVISAQWVRRANLLLVATAALVMLAMGIWLLLPFFGSTLSNFSCSGHDETSAPMFGRSVTLIGAAVVSFIVGNGLGGHRSQAEIAYTGSSRVVPFLLTLLFFFVACALAYETLATWLTSRGQNQFQTITTLIRCATFHYPVPAGVAVSAASLLIGQWLHRTQPA